MFNLNESIRYWLYPFPTDMRKSFYTLSGIVTDQMGCNIRSGDAFIFINRPCTSMKVLHMETGGLVIYHLRLEEGTFKLPAFDQESRSLRSSWKNLMLMIQGIDAQTCKHQKRWKG
jgi:transposase